jgi:hypothetical protein
MMMGESSNVNWHDMSNALPAFLTAILMPLTYSITNGMIFGLAASLAFYFTTGAMFTDVKKFFYDTKEDAPLEDDLGGGGVLEVDDGLGETDHLLLDSRRDSDAARSSIEKARRSLNGSLRNVDYGTVLY